VVIGVVGAGSYPLLGTGLLLAGIGAGVALTVTADTIVSAVPKEKAGAAAAVSETAYELGTALGIALLGSLLTAVYRAGLVVPAGAEAARDSLTEATGMAEQIGPEVLAAAQQAFVTAVQATTLVAALVLAVSAVLAARWLPVRSPDPASGRSPRSG
ncbi:MAG: MFS transporter, partial [Pseudonocardia sp.]|nr:MFS transporter [Pseudonocardia sp.]